MRTVRDGVLGAFGRRCRTGHGVLRSTRVASECGGLCMGSEPRSRARWGGSTRANAGVPRGCLGGRSALLLGLGHRVVPLHRGPRALGLRPERPAHFCLAKGEFYFCVHRAVARNQGALDMRYPNIKLVVQP